MNKSLGIIEIIAGLSLIVFIYLSLLGDGFFNIFRGREIGLWSLLPGVLLLIAGIAGLSRHKFRKIQIIITEVFILGFILVPLDGYGYLSGFLSILTVPLFFLIAGYVNSSLLGRDGQAISFIKVWFLTFLISPLTLGWLKLGIFAIYSYLPGYYSGPSFTNPDWFEIAVLLSIYPVYTAGPIVLTPLGIYLQRKREKGNS